MFHHHHECAVLPSIDHGLCISHQPCGVGRSFSSNHEEDRPVCLAPVGVIDKVPLLPGLQGGRQGEGGGREREGEREEGGREKEGEGGDGEGG